VTITPTRQSVRVEMSDPAELLDTEVREESRHRRWRSACISPVSIGQKTFGTPPTIPPHGMTQLSVSIGLSVNSS
jgi:hypothetical protein